MRLCCAILLVLLGVTFSVAQSDANIPENLAPITADNVNQLQTLLTIQSQSDILAIHLGDEQLIWLTSRDSVLHIYDLTTREQTEVSLDERMTIASFSNDGTLLGCNCSNRNPLQDFAVLNVQTGEKLFSVWEFGTSNIAFNLNNSLVATTSGGSRMDQAITVRNLETHSTMMTLTLSEQFTTSVAFSPDGNYIAAGFEHQAQIWSMTQNNLLFEIEQFYPTSDLGGFFLRIGDIAFSHDSTLVASMSPEGFVWVWDIHTGQLEHQLFLRSMSVDFTGVKFSFRNSDILFSPQDDFIITANGEEMRLWSVSDGDLLRTIFQDTSRIAFNPAGTLMATTDGENALMLWGVPEND